MTLKFYKLNKRITSWGILIIWLFVSQTMVFAAAKTIDKVQRLIVQKIPGKVSDEKGEGLPGVSISLLGSTKGTTTDANGNFSIDAEKGDILVFSSIGYEKKEIKIGNETLLQVSLKTDDKLLSEV